jgi:hypothetical protein
MNLMEFPLSEYIYKFDLQRTSNDLTGAGWHSKSPRRTMRNSYCGANVG